MSLENLQAERAQNEADLADVEQMLAEVPDMQEALEMKPALVARIKEIDAEIAALQPASTTPAEKWSKENHPAYRKQTASAAPVAEEKKANHSFKVNDTVLAKYHEDKQFYEARIISITGSSAAPIYTVQFKGYSGTETVKSNELRPLASSASSSAAQKRKADGSPVVSNPSTPAVSTPVNPGVISAEANINTALANAVKQDQIKALDGSDRSGKPAKKMKPTKALESNKSNWKAWQSKASTSKASKVTHKESMFRTGDAPTARVGFTGSGQAMRKDVQRTRHNYTLDD